MNKPHKKIAVIGLGYVGLPLAVEFGKKRHVVGFDIKDTRIQELQQGVDHTLEVSSEELASASNLSFTNQIEDLKDSEIYIVTVPTPIDKNKEPDLSLLKGASEMIGGLINQGDLVIYESTVYPGATEEVCVPVLEKFSGMLFNQDFSCGYSPERINPGDKEHNLVSIVKVTSGSNKIAAQEVDDLYASIITAGTFRAQSIKIAEAAKVIENTQRDLNIALMNELAMIFTKLGIDTKQVLEAASTKWNFLPFSPGLVGGHCIGVDPYYLTFKAQKAGYDPKVILAGRNINDEMALNIGSRIKKMIQINYKDLSKTKALVLGLTFKENCPDIRNTKVIDLVKFLNEENIEVDVYDPWADRELARKEFGIKCLTEISKSNKYHAIIIAVGHKQFANYKRIDLEPYMENKGIIFDIKSLLPEEEVDGRI